MINRYTPFTTNLSIPIKVNFGCANKFKDLQPLHTTKDIRIGVGHTKYQFFSRLSYIQIVYYTEGSNTYVTDKGKYQVEEGDCFIAGRRLIRGCDKKTINPNCAYTVSFSHDFCKSLGIDDTITCLVKKDDSVVKSCVLDIINAIDKKGEGWEGKAIDIAKKLLVHINERYGEHSFPVDDTDVFPDEIMYRLDEYIRAHLSEKITLDDMAKVAGLKYSQFNKRFKATTRYTPVMHLNIARCMTAMDLILTTDFSMDDIASMCGYCNKSFLYKNYREIFGANAYDHAKCAPIEAEYKLKEKQLD